MTPAGFCTRSFVPGIRNLNPWNARAYFTRFHVTSAVPPTEAAKVQVS